MCDKSLARGQDVGASAQQCACGSRGLGVLITFVFFINIVSWDKSQLVGLGIPLRYIAKPSYARLRHIHKRWAQAQCSRPRDSYQRLFSSRKFEFQNFHSTRGQ
jgi:hypothetical protein